MYLILIDKKSVIHWFKVFTVQQDSSFLVSSSPCGTHQVAKEVEEEKYLKNSPILTAAPNICRHFHALKLVSYNPAKPRHQAIRQRVKKIMIECIK